MLEEESECPDVNYFKTAWRDGGGGPLLLSHRSVTLRHPKARGRSRRQREGGGPPGSQDSPPPHPPFGAPQTSERGKTLGVCANTAPF